MFDPRFTETLCLVRVALMAALIAVGSWISLPIGPVPLTLQNFFVMLAGLRLGPRYGLYAMLLFVGAGCLGLPVFAGGKAGFGVLLGPTGGYLLGYMVLVVLSGLLGASLVRNAALLLGGSLVVYGFGVWRLMATLNLAPEAAVSAGMLPFLPGDGLKIVAILALARLFERRGLASARSSGPATEGERPQDSRPGGSGSGGSGSGGSGFGASHPGGSRPGESRSGGPRP